MEIKTSLVDKILNKFLGLFLIIVPLFSGYAVWIEIRQLKGIVGATIGIISLGSSPYFYLNFLSKIVNY